MQKFKKKIYKNGLRVITVPMKDNPTVTVLVLVGTGSDYETKSISGISHFLEHMCFKGTVGRPLSKIISYELDALGCQYNAFTDHEYTGYYAKGDSKKFKQIFDIVSDIYLNSIFPEAEIEKEKGVIIEEINMYQDDPQAHLQLDIFPELLYKDQPAGWNIAGTKETVRGIKRDDFVEYRDKHYTADNTVIVVSGNISDKDVYKEVEKYFNGIRTNKSLKKNKTKSIQNGPEVLIKTKQTDQTHFVLGFRAFSMFDKRVPVLSVLSGILGIGMSSRLFSKLREEMGVAYYVRSSSDLYLDHGSFQISAGVTNERTKEVLKEILKECKKIIDEEITEKELAKVKSFMVGNMKMALESTDDVANFYGGQELLRGEVQSLEEKIKKIQSVEIKEIKKLAKTIFTTENLNLAIIGPYKDAKEFKDILKF
jgi:predicted Zn-dependent peptidase